MKLVQACLCAENTLQLRFSRRGGAVKLQRTCLSARKVRESSFHYCGGPVKVAQACLCAENTLQLRFSRRGGAVKPADMFKYQKSPRKQF